MQENPQNINNILQILEDAKSESIYKINAVTSKKLELLFEPMRTADQKKLIKSLLDSPYFSSDFNISILDILRSTYKGEGDLLDQPLNSLDKILIILKCRSINIDDSYTFTYDENKTKTISLEEHLKSITPKVIKDKQLKSKNYDITLGYPTIKSEYEIEKYSKQLLDSLNKESQSDIKTAISTLFILNIVKYIKYIKIKDNEINFDNLYPQDKLKAAEMLESIITKEIIKEIDNYFYSGIKSITTVEFEDDGEIKTHEIKIDNTLFVS